MVCSLVYAYFLSKVRLLSAAVWMLVEPQWTFCLHQTVQSETFPVPLLNIRQSDLVLRSDNVSLLRLIGLSPDLLLFRDQLDLQELLRAGCLQLTLVDHNVLSR